MATANVVTEMKTRTVEVEEAYLENSITLTLSEADARALHVMTGKVGGDEKGPRGAYDRIREALDTVIGPRHQHPEYRAASGYMSFEDGSV